MATTEERLNAALDRGLELGRGTTSAKSKKAVSDLRDVGVFSVGFKSSDEEIENYVQQLRDDQRPYLEEREKEWRQNIAYVANEQYIAYHRDSRKWIPKKAVPWRIRSIYNVCAKAVKLRVARLTENKPALNVIAANTERGDVEAAEYKNDLFWHNWHTLDLHNIIVRARRWATKCGSGFIMTGWDADAGDDCPVTRKRKKFKQVPVMDPRDPTGKTQAIDPGTGTPVTEQVYDGIEEVYIDAKGAELGPVYSFTEDPLEPGRMRKTRNEPPPNCDYYCEGRPFARAFPSFSILWDRYVDDIVHSWFVIVDEVWPAAKILGQFNDDPRYLDLLKEAKPASEEERAIHYEGLRAVGTPTEFGTPSSEPSRDGAENDGAIAKEYLVRQLWIYPKNQSVKRLWGRNGALIITVGGKLFDKKELPKWARKFSNFIQLIDEPEEGNHYHKPILRDLIPIQDDINRARSLKAERSTILARLIMWAQQNHQMNVQVLGGMPAVLLTGRSKPEPLQLGGAAPDLGEFYRESLDAAQDVGQMNDATVGRNPAAGTAAKAIYALQYAEERGIAEISNQQDIALKRLALSLDDICRHEFTENRKIRIVGEDRSFLIEREIQIEHLQAEVDYYFLPGSMMSRTKEAVKNEVLQLLGEKLIEPWQARKMLASAVPEAFRQSYDLQEANARRKLQKITARSGEQLKPEPWENPDVCISVLEEFMLTQKFEVVGDDERKAIMQLWQAYQVQKRTNAAAAAGQPTPTQPTAVTAPAAAPAPGPGDNNAAATGAAQLEQQATTAEQPAEAQVNPGVATQ